MLGIDEAGRGPVMGPMVYGAAYWPVADNDAMSALGFDDSKALSAESRAQLFEKMRSTEGLGWIVRLISAAEISDKMQRQTSNLNEMSRDAAIQLINEVQKKGAVVKKVFVDTVGDPRWYQSFLTKHFNGTIEFRVEKKADSLFKVVSAASIAAKVTRDRVISDWKWESPALDLPTDFGSGYPSDPKTKAWLTTHMDNVFVFPNIIRFSWGTVEPFYEKAVKVEWPHEKELEKCLHRGELWQFSTQFGGWLRIKLLLFSHALVVDPDADTGTPRRRRNSLKLWLDLCLVKDIVSVQKTDAVLRRGSYSQVQSDARFQFAVETQELKLQFATATTAQRDEWLHCLLLATKLQMQNLQSRDAFLRFASSGSESDEENQLSSPTSWSEENALRSAQLLSQRPRLTQVCAANERHDESSNPVALMILNIMMKDESGDSISTIVPVSEASQESVSVRQVKVDAVRQMQAELRSSDKDNMSRLHKLLRRDVDTFILYLDIGEQWLKDEQLSIGHYILGCANRRITLELVPMNRMPQPTIDLAIVGTKNKVSDLSQRTFTSYLIDVVFNDTTWQLARRYKEFDALRSHLKKKYPDTMLPGLPPKHVFTPVDGEFINNRKQQLEAFLKQLLLHPIVSTDVLLMSFLGVVSISRDPELGYSKKSVIHVTSLHDSVGCGDIILFSCRFGASRLQRKFTGSKYDHVGIVVPGESRFLLRIMEATSEGIQVYALKPRLMAYSREVSNTIVVRKMQTERTPELLEVLMEFVHRVEGNPYSIFGILRSTGESDRNIINSVRVAGNVDDDGDDSFSNTGGSSTSSTSSSPVTEGADSTKSQDSKRKYFCSSLVAAAWKELGWLQTKRKSSSFWPGSFEDGGEVERCLAQGVALGPETVIDCRIVEVGLSAHR
ncbi:Ribonuclease H2 subunit A [Phytophthora palmivora]|uniref:Ribonuclease n=1 Tax=Phytophthora palmivora TaxID=4796 RepID=A0A2P4YKB2_9STRA|nr:Ribonuclease H2 subunit A [Phytophthora palmivora]